MRRQLLNSTNWSSAARAMRVIHSPYEFCKYLQRPAPNKFLTVSSPTGPHKIMCRNRETAKTIYSVFAREDYITGNDQCDVIDLGANVGVASIYFLSRNTRNKVYCVEPDPNNLPFLRNNLSRYPDRTFIQDVAISSSHTGQMEFNISTDGKYSSFLPIGDNKLVESKLVNVVKVNDVIENALNVLDSDNVVVKLDIEGLELEVAKSIDFCAFPRIRRLIVEGLGIGKELTRDNTIHIANNYVEIIDFQ